MKTTMGVALTLLLFACGATTGHQINFDDTAKLTVGVSTQADARAIFGPPLAMSAINGTTYLTWVYGHADYAGANAGSKTLALSFGPDGKYIGVSSMGATGTETLPPTPAVAGMATALPPATADGG